MDLTTIQRVRLFLDGGGSSGFSSNVDSTLLSGMISSVSRQIEQFLGGRALETGSYTEYFNVQEGQSVFLLKAFPVSSITSVHNDAEGQYSNPIVISSDFYSINNGRALYLTWPLSPGHDGLKVVYTGGLAADTDALIAAAPDLALACDMQVAFLYKRRATLDLKSQTTEGGQTSFASISLLPQVKQLLDAYRMKSVG
jgi:hypothetical protein